MGFLEILGKSGICVRPGHGAELERGPVRQGARYPRVVQPAQLVELLARDHERGQVGRVDREEHHGEHRPHVGHEPRGETPGRVHVH